MCIDFQKRTFSVSSYTNFAVHFLPCTLYHSFNHQLYFFLLLYLYFVYISSCTTRYSLLLLYLYFVNISSYTTRYSLLLLYLYFVYISSCTTVLFIMAVPVLCIHFQLYHCTCYYCCTCTLYTFPTVPLYSLLLLYLYFVYISSCATVLFNYYVPVLYINSLAVPTVHFINDVPVL